MSTLAQREQAHEERSLEVYKRNDMIQRARFTLSIQEHRTVLYAISKIQPADTYLKEYTFEIKDFYRVIGWDKESYTEFKQMLKALSDKSWWATIKRNDGTEFESLVRWFTTVRSDKRSGKVTIKFHEDMMPYLVQLAQGTEFYTKYQLQYVLPMSCIYSPRLYEILKSYQYNNIRWFFDVDELRRLLDCQNYERWPDFRRYALEPAVEEINKYTDLKIAYKVEKTGRRVSRVIFGMLEKTDGELLETQRVVSEALDGQMSIEDMFKEVDEDPLYQLEKQHRMAVIADQERKAEREAKIEAARLGLKDFYGGK